MPRRPDLKTRYETPRLYTYSGWDSYVDIDRTLRELEVGNFFSISTLADAFGRDDRITSVIDTRVGALRAVALAITPGMDKRIARKAAELLGGVDETTGEWERILSPGTMYDMVKWGFLGNFAVAEQRWVSIDGVWWPRLKFWHTQFVRWDDARQAFMLRTNNGAEIQLPNIDENPNSDGRWVIWCPRGYQYAWMKGLVRGLALKYIMRGWTQRDFARWCEVHGIPMRVAIVPNSERDTDQAKEFAAAVANTHGEPSVMAPQGSPEEGKYDVQYREAVSRSFDGFDIWKKHLDTDIAVLVLGQELTTAVGDSGSRALGDIQNLIRLDKAREDADFASCLYHQVLYWWAKFNYADERMAPRLKYMVDPPDDLQAKGNSLLILGQAVNELRMASDNVDTDGILEDASVRMLSEEQKAARDAAREDAADGGADGDPAGGGAGGGGGGSGQTVNQARHAIGLEPLTTADGEPDPDGDLKVDDFKAKHPGESPTADAEEGDDEEKIKKSAVKLRAPVTEGIWKRYKFAGLPVAIENPRGSRREWTDETGKSGSTFMHYDYGFIDTGHIGKDEEDIDCYVGPHESATHVHVIAQHKKPDYKRYDEDKVFIGFPTQETARAAYAIHRDDGDKAIGAITSMSLARFKEKLTRRKPTTTTKIRARASGPVVMMRASRAPFHDRLTEAGIISGSAAMAPLLDAIKGGLDDVDNFDDLEKVLVKTLKTHDSSKMREAVARIRIMAKLAGRAATRHEVK